MTALGESAAPRIESDRDLAQGVLRGCELVSAKILRLIPPRFPGYSGLSRAGPQRKSASKGRGNRRLSLSRASSPRQGLAGPQSRRTGTQPKPHLLADAFGCILVAVHSLLGKRFVAGLRPASRNKIRPKSSSISGLFRPVSSCVVSSRDRVLVANVGWGISKCREGKK